MENYSYYLHGKTREWEFTERPPCVLITDGIKIIGDTNAVTFFQ